MRLAFWVLLFFTAVSVACSAGRDGTRRDGSAGGGDGGPGRDGSVGPRVDAPGAPCALIPGVAAPALAPVDIVWTIDNSGSMSEEASLVQEQMDDFVADIVASGVDFRVVVITAPGFVTVAPALAADAMRFRRVEASVNSHDAFEVTLAQFPAYSDFLRTSAVTHFVVVTDDESDTAETDFRTRMETNLRHSFIYHAVASEEAEHDCVDLPLIGRMCQPGCVGPRGDAADVGRAYYRLAAATGGTQFSICSVDWSPLWTTLRASVVVSAAIPCFYDLPDPPAGTTFDEGHVNVVFTSSSGASTTYPRAIDSSRCLDAAGDSVRAWYYDDNDNPTRILLCPAACMQVESDPGGHLDVALNCETEMILI